MSELAVGSAADEPFLHLLARNGQVEVRGQSAFEVGLTSDATGLRKPEPGYAGWQWDGAGLTVRNCRYGLRPLYYFARAGEVCVSTSVLQLLRQGASRELDYGALAVFVRFGSYVGDDTPFAEVRAVPPNVRFRWSPQAFELAGQWPEVRPQQISRDEAIDRFVDLFRKSVASRLPHGPFVLPLSGGRDSRHILLACLANDRRPDVCMTARHYPPLANEDERIARLLCAEFGVEHAVIDQSPSRIAGETWKNRTAGFCTIEHAWTRCIADWIAGRGLPVIDGLAGDALAGGAQQDKTKADYARSGNVDGWSDNLLEHFLHCAHEPALDDMLPAGLRKRLDKSVAMERLTRELSRHLDKPSPLSSFHLWNRTRRATAVYTFQILPRSVDVICPFLDDDVFDHLMSLPLEMTCDKKFHTDAIQRAYPAASHIPFETPGAPRAEDRAHHRRIGRELAWQAIRHWRSSMVRTDRLIPRMLRHAVEGRAESVAWSSPLVALYLLQLEAVSRGEKIC